VVGERCRRGVIWDFVHKLWKNPRELEILGDGKQSKEYIYVADCVDGIMTGYNKSKGRINIFNLAVEDNKTVDEVAELVMREMKLKNVKIDYTGGSKGWVGDNPVVHLDLSKLKSFGCKPRYSAEEAIVRTTRGLWTSRVRLRPRLPQCRNRPSHEIRSWVNVAVTRYTSVGD
jgi:UDP-glucose 4-epimerase